MHSHKKYAGLKLLAMGTGKRRTLSTSRRKRNARTNSLKYLLTWNLSHSLLTTVSSELALYMHPHTESVTSELQSVGFTPAHKAELLLFPWLCFAWTVPRKPFSSFFPATLNKLLLVSLPSELLKMKQSNGRMTRKLSLRQPAHKEQSTLWPRQSFAIVCVF